MPETKKEKITPKKTYERDTQRLTFGRFYSKGGNAYKNATIEDDYSDIGNDTEKYNKFLKAEEKLKNLTYSPMMHLTGTGKKIQSKKAPKSKIKELEESIYEFDIQISRYKLLLEELKVKACDYNYYSKVFYLEGEIKRRSDDIGRLKCYEMIIKDYNAGKITFPLNSFYVGNGDTYLLSFSSISVVERKYEKLKEKLLEDGYSLDKLNKILSLLPKRLEFNKSMIMDIEKKLAQLEKDKEEKIKKLEKLKELENLKKNINIPISNFPEYNLNIKDSLDSYAKDFPISTLSDKERLSFEQKLEEFNKEQEAEGVDPSFFEEIKISERD